MQVPDSLESCLNCGVRTPPRRTEPAMALQSVAGGVGTVAAAPPDAPVSAVRRGMNVPPAAPRPPEPAPPSGPRVGTGFAVVCSVCGRGPATRVHLRRLMSILIVVRFKKLDEPFCLDHGVPVAKEYLRRTLIEGWWGLLSLYLAPAAIASNLVAIRKLRKLPPPVGEIDASRVGSLPEYVRAAALESDDDRSARRSIFRTVIVSIALGVVGLVGIPLAGDARIESIETLLSIGTIATLAVYVSVGILLVYQLRIGHIVPHFYPHGRSWAVLAGSLMGAAMACALAGLFSFLKGHTTSDPGLLFTISEGTTAHIVLMVVIAVLAAPFIEEPLFRGLLVESLRSRGRWSAILAGAITFSLWHLRPESIQYYIVMGVIFGLIYWRLGLAGSISAHLLFNGVLVVFAFMAFDGGGPITTPTGVHADLPAGWHEVTKQDLPPNTDLAVESPVGAALLVQHVDRPPLSGDAIPPLDQLPPGVREPRLVKVAGNTALRFEQTINGVDLDVVLIPAGTKGWSVTMNADSTVKAGQQLESILNSLSFPEDFGR